MIRSQPAVALEETAVVQKTKVLVVDDDHAIRRFLHISLVVRGYEGHGRNKKR